VKDKYSWWEGIRQSVGFCLSQPLTTLQFRQRTMCQQLHRNQCCNPIAFATLGAVLLVASLGLMATAPTAHAQEQGTIQDGQRERLRLQRERQRRERERRRQLRSSAPRQAAQQAEANSENLSVVGRWAEGPTYAVDLRGDTAYFGSGSQLAIADFSDPDNPVELGQVLVPDIPQDVEVAGDYAYVATDEGGGLRIIDISDPTNPQEVGAFDAFWARNLSVEGSYAYLTTGSGLKVIDVSDPNNPSEVGFVEHIGIRVSEGLSVANGYAYVAGDGVQVIDISDPSNPQEVGRFETVATVYGVIAVEGYAYITVDDNDETEGVRAIDISDPANPQEVSALTLGSRFYRNGMVLSEDFLYVAANSENKVVDVSNPMDLQEVGSFASSPAASMTKAGNRLLASENGGVHAYDISDPTNPQETGILPVVGFRRDGLAVSENHAYMPGQVIRVVDVSDPTNPQEVSTFESSCSSRCELDVMGDHLYTESGAVIDVSDPANLQQVGSFNLEGLFSLTVTADYAYVLTYSNSVVRLHILNLSNPATPQEVGSLDLGSNYFSFEDLAVANGNAYVATEEEGLRIIDVSEPNNPQEVGVFENGNGFIRLCLTIIA